VNFRSARWTEARPDFIQEEFNSIRALRPYEPLAFRVRLTRKLDDLLGMRGRALEGPIPLDTLVFIGIYNAPGKFFRSQRGTAVTAWLSTTSRSYAAIAAVFIKPKSPSHCLMVRTG